MNSTSILSTLIVLTLFIGCKTTTPTSKNTGAERRVINFEGMERYFFLYKPKAFHSSASESRKIMIIVHGGGGDADRMAEYTGFQFEELAESSGNTLIVYPNGYKKGWNDGRETKMIEAHTAKVDDVGFLTKIIGDLSAEFKILPRHVFVGGVSNGGFMSYRMACEKSQIIGGIANVVGSLADSLKSQCKPKLPVSIISITGTADPLNPFNGGEVKGVFGFFTRGKSVSTEATLKFFGNQFACTKDGIDSVLLPDIDKSDGSTVRFIDWKCKNPQIKIHQYVVVDGGHQWPGGYELRKTLLGPINRDISASKLIFDFFSSIKFQDL